MFLILLAMSLPWWPALSAAAVAISMPDWQQQHNGTWQKKTKGLTLYKGFHWPRRQGAVRYVEDIRRTQSI